MIELHPLTLKDKSWCDEIFAMEDSQSADFNFGNICCEIAILQCKQLIIFFCIK